MQTKVFVAGHRGLLGSALTRRLQSAGYSNLLLKTRAEADLANQAETNLLFETEKPEVVFLAAAKVGGIMANKENPADFIGENLQIQTNVIDAAYRNGCRKLIFFGSSCIYPKHAEQPIKEESLLTGPLESTNEAYAVAKIAGLKMCESYRKQYGFDAICLMPCNLYGPGDNFDPQNSHVLAALLRRFHEAKAGGKSEVTVWGTGTPVREFLHVDDLADAALFALEQNIQDPVLNVGTGKGTTIKDLAAHIAEVTGFRGETKFDSSKPDGTPIKVLDVCKIAGLGWCAKVGLAEGLRSAYDWYLKAYGPEVMGAETRDKTPLLT